MFFVTCGVFVALMLTILIGGTALLAHRASSRVAAELAQIREAGEPASAVELAEYYQLPPNVEDTTELWLDATHRLNTMAFAIDARELPIVGAEWKEIPPPGQPWGDLEAAEGLLRKYHASLSAMHDAADLGGAARYPVDFCIDSPILIDRAGALLLALETHVCAHRGDLRGAARAIRTISMLARSLEQEPISVSLLVRLSCDGIAREQLQSLLPSVDFSDEDLRGLQDHFRAIDYRDGLQRAMVGERAMGINAFQNPDSLGKEARLYTGSALRVAQGSSFVFYLEHMDRGVCASQQPWPQALRDAEQAEAKKDDLVDNASLLTSLTHSFLRNVASHLDIVFHITARGVAMNDAADAAIAVELYRRQHGKLPERLEELVPDFLPQVPTDPFDGQPLRYVVREEEYVIYSVGTDRVDNGGTGDPEYGDTRPDSVFRVRRL
ncbi:MAG: hypothetical protein HQ582_32540 [Planctomycetes bacterium]|nr:hypothetical protein [Planctomycetota bacterium]